LKLVIIGYGTAGITSASYAKLYSRQTEVVVLERRPYAIYHPCALIDAIAERVELEKTVEPPPRMRGLQVLLNKEVTRIDPSGKVIEYIDRSSGREESIQYDKLIIATGSKPFVPKSLKEALKIDGVFTLKVVEDAERIKKHLVNTKRIAVIGAGAIGVALSIMLSHRLNKQVTLIEAQDSILPGYMDKEVSNTLKKMLECEVGVKVLTSSPVIEISRASDGIKVTAGECTCSYDAVILSIGVRASSELAKEAGLELNQYGKIKVNERMETSKPDIYAAGDVAEVKNIITGKPAPLYLASIAFRQGRVAGINAVGGSEKYMGSIGTWVESTPIINYGGTGLTLKQALNEGFNAKAVTVTAWHTPPYMPEGEKVTIRLVADIDSHRILGCQVIGKPDITKYLDLTSYIIIKNGTLQDLISMETAYMPSLSEVYTPLYVAAEALLRRIKR